MDKDRTRTNSGANPAGFLAPFVAGASLVVVAAALALALIRGGDTGMPFPALPELQADAGDGEFLYFPNRRHVWVVHPQSGRIIHYKFLDTSQGVVERSYVAELDQEIFPPGDTVFALSERNIEDLLWVGNRRTGDFQLWRRNVRDGRLVTDPLPVQSAGDLLNDRAVKSSKPKTRP